MSRFSSRRALAQIGVAALVLATMAAIAPAGAAGYELIRTVAGGGSGGDGGPATDSAVDLPRAVAADAAGNFYFTEFWTGRVRKVDPAGVVSTVAGGGNPGDGVGDGGAATDAQLGQPGGLALNSAGTVLYVSEGSGQRVRKVDLASGTITTAAGTGVFGYTGDGGPATAAKIASPAGLAVDAPGNLYIAQNQYKVVRKVDTAGIITTVAGGGEWGHRGDGGPATAAFIDFPEDVDVDAAGNLYIADSGGNTPGLIRKVDTAGTITTVAGGGTPADGVGDGGPATGANLFYPRGLDLNDAGVVYIADTEHHRVRRVDPAGTITTVAGTGEPGFSGDGGPPTQARLASPWSLETHATYGLLVADSGNQRIRQVVTVPDLMAVVKTDAPDPVNIDEELTYTVELTNNGTGPATGVTLTDPLPSSVDFGSATATQGACDQAGGTVTCTLGDMAAGATATVTIRVTPRLPGLISNTATVGADGDDPFPGNNSATARTSVGDRGCGRVITADTRLSEDLGPCPANGIIVGADNVTLDLAGHRVFGFEGPGDGTSAGVRLPARKGVMVKNGTVSGFDAGVVINRGQNNTLSRLTVRDNVGPDDPQGAELGDGIVLFNSAGNSIVDNVIAHNGIFDGIGVLGFESHKNLVKGNVVEDTVGPGDWWSFGQGIILSAPGLGGYNTTFITGNMVTDNVVRRNASAGIANINNAYGEISANTVEGNGFAKSPGNGIGIQVGPGVQDPATHLVVQHNQVHGNADDGIRVTWRSNSNQILNNDASGNARAYDGQYAGVWLFDLRDENVDQAWQPTCADNVWRNNTWGSGGYAPDCTARGGKGPKPSHTPATSKPSDKAPPTRRGPSS